VAGAALKLTLSYDGSDFAGSQIQPGQRTVQAELDRALERLAGGQVSTVFAGRTDAGVHAAAQVVSLRDPRPTMGERAWLLALNAHLPEDVAAVAIQRARDGFHARYDARWREYRYRIWSGPSQPLVRRFTWQVRGELDAGALDGGARSLLGERDLAAVAGGGEGVPWSDRRDAPRGTVRRISRCSARRIAPWWGEPDGGTLVEVRIVADGFLPRMVRNIVALLVEVGQGKQPVEWIDRVLATKDRRLGGGTAPPHGLTLWRVGYGTEAPEPDPAQAE
jgi:tRNA pseudouridine38-40 synthase